MTEEAAATVQYDVNLRLNSGLRQLIENVAIARDEGARKWIDKCVQGRPWPTEGVERMYREVMDGASGGTGGVSITVSFRNVPEDRHLIVYADARVPRRYVAVAMWTDGDRGPARETELTVSEV